MNSSTRPATCQTLILGRGYLGRTLEGLLSDEKQRGQLLSTSRRPGGADLVFDLHDSRTWKNLPQARHTVWTFPAEPLNLVREFWEQSGSSLGRVVCIGSTSALLSQEEDQWVHEHTGLDLSQQRVLGEEFLRQQGCMTLLSAGIYGPERDPIDWVKRGLVGKSPKYVNMIHVIDLARLALRALEVGQLGELYIASDGYPQRWDEVITYWQTAGRLGSVETRASLRPSKRVDSSWTMRRLDYQIRYPDFKSALW